MTALEREWKLLTQTEARMRLQAARRSAPQWKRAAEEKLPPKLTAGLEGAFEKAFRLIFEKGTPVIERTYQRENLEKDFQIRDYAVDIRRGRRELAQVRRMPGRSSALTTLATTVEGIGLGALGIGLPDIALWVGVLLRSIYETALRYGFSYDTPEERLFILKMMEASMSSGRRWAELNRQVDNYIQKEDPAPPGEEALERQIRETAKAFAGELLVTKFVQGLPLVGVLGGAANPVYYRRVMGYVQVKYRKRYLWGKLYG